MRRAAKVDSNQGAIVDALRAVGISVAPTHTVGDGFPDLVCGYRGATHLLEVKMPGKGLTDDQEQFVRGWRGNYHIVTDVIEALWVFGIKTVSAKW